ncbi:unnamed protein product [Calypogeia fissa]
MEDREPFVSLLVFLRRSSSQTSVATESTKSPTPEMRVKKDRWNFAWNSLTKLALSITVIPLLWPDSLGPQSFRSSQFVEWEVSKPRHPLLLDGIKRNLLFGPEPEDFWKPPPKGFRSCPDPTSPLPSDGGIPTEGYLQVFLEGGLNQQRMGICDAVAVAKILNVTLVLPHFDVNPVWQDTSKFEDVFDVEHFLRSLENDVHIVTELPSEFAWSTREYYSTGWRETRVKDTPSRAGPEWYLSRVLPVIQSHGIAAVAPFSHRLGFDGIPPAIQRLRCRVNFEALRFKPAIRDLGDLIIQRLQGSAPWKIDGIASSAEEDDDGNEEAAITRFHNPSPRKFVALHLRFDKDMAAHSACEFGGGRAEELSLSKYRRDYWHGKGSNRLDTIDKVRELGKCPLTPEEVAIIMVGLGFRSTTLLYLASYKVYGGEGRMAHLRSIFPLMSDKYTLTTDAEIEPFKGKATQLAAIDYHVSLHSDAFMSASRGNMHNALVAHRAFEIDGLTIRLDMVLVAQLFRNQTIGWFDFEESLRAGHKARMGQLNSRKPAQSIYTYPAPDCMCAVN